MKASVVRSVLYYIAGAIFALSMNSVYYVFGDSNVQYSPFFFWSAFALMVVLTASIWVTHSVETIFLGRWTVWAAFVALVYVSVALANCRVGSLEVMCFFWSMALFPLAIHLMKCANELDGFLRAFVNVMLVLAVASLVLWLLGDIVKVLQPNCTIDYRWTSRTRADGPSGFFYLLFQTQQYSIDLTRVGWGSLLTWRNTGIYTEAPMYSLALCYALFCEIIRLGKRRNWVLAVFAATIITTFATTGYIVLLVLGVAYAGKRAVKSKYRIPLVIFMVVMLALAVYLFGGKLSSHSGDVRFNDFVASFIAWSQSPLFGYGFNNLLGIRSNMLPAHIGGGGATNSLGVVVATGGLVFLLLYVTGLVGYFVGRGDYARKVVGLCLAFAWGVTVTVSLPITALMFSLGVEHLCAFKLGPVINEAKNRD